MSKVKVIKALAPKVSRLDMSHTDVLRRVPELTEAARLVKEGRLTPEEYARLVREHKPVEPYRFVPAPATTEEAMRALREPQRAAWGGTRDMTAGERADLRLDIPAYRDHGVWVNAVHRPERPTVYGPVSSVRGATMHGAPEKAMKVAMGGPKAPFATIRGEWSPVTEAEAIERAQAYLDHPEWRQVGYDPERHGYFYDRRTMEPIVGGEEVLQVGPLVLTRGAKVGDPGDFPFAGGGLARAARAVREMGRRAAPETRGMTQIIKEPGGNWAESGGSREPLTSKLQVRVRSRVDPRQTIREAREMGVDVENQSSFPQLQRAAAMNDWLDRQLNKYIRNQMGTESDPIRKLAEEGVLHYEPDTLAGASVRRMRASQGYPERGVAQSDLARRWEDETDYVIGEPRPFSDYALAARAGQPTAEELELVGGKYAAERPNALAFNADDLRHEIGTSGYGGFGHLRDELHNALDPESGLPQNLRLRPESLGRLSVSDAVRRVADINAWRAAQKAEADLARANSPAIRVHKEYAENNPRGLRWVELRASDRLPEGYVGKYDDMIDPDYADEDDAEMFRVFRVFDRDGKEVFATSRADLEDSLDDIGRGPGTADPEQAAARALSEPALQDALKYEGEMMGHCVGGYCPDVMSGRSRIYSLRDAKGNPHVTIEVGPPIGNAPVSGADLEAMEPGLFQAYKDQMYAENGIGSLHEWLRTVRPDLASRDSIVQIKGKSNLAPNAEYQPYVQDFIRSGRWGQIGDFGNTGLQRRADLPEQYRGVMPELGEYLTADEIAKIQGGEGMAKGGKVLRVAKEALEQSRRAEEPSRRMQDILRSHQAPSTTPMGTMGPLMPRSQGMYTPNVEQVDLPRIQSVDRARAANVAPKYTERMQDLLDSRLAREKVNALIRKGDELGMREWYGTEPLRQVAMDIGLSPEEYRSFMGQLASASQRNPVNQQNRMGSYLWHLSRTGQLPEDAYLLTNKIKKNPELAPEGTPVELPEGYGSLAQSAIFSRGKQIAHGDIEGALPPNAKLGTFYRNLLGNLRPVTVDVNAVRGPVIERGDPRWLETQVVEKDPNTGERINVHRPREMVESGLMTIKQAKERPGFWIAAPSGSEYAGFEDLWQRAARRFDVAPAEAQALGWYGSGDVTALKTAPELYVDNLERLVRETAQQTGQNPLRTLERVIRGEDFLRGSAPGKAEGGEVRRISAFDSPEAAEKWAREMHAASGGAVMMAQGGQPVLGPDESVPDSTDSGRMMYDQQLAEGGAPQGSGGMRERQEVARRFLEDVWRRLREQTAEEVASLRQSGAARDLVMRGLVAGTLGTPVDVASLAGMGGQLMAEATPGLNMSPERAFMQRQNLGRDLPEAAPGRLAQRLERPPGGTEWWQEQMVKRGLASPTERPVLETAAGIGVPVAAGAAWRGGLNRMANRAYVNARRPFVPATVTTEAVAPDLANARPRGWQDEVTRALITGENAPVSMRTMGGQRTFARPGQGVYMNEAGRLETNPMVAVDVPGAGNLSTNRPLRRDIAQAGVDLNQEAMAAHRFVPMLYNEPRQASAMLVRPSSGALSNEQVIAMGQRLPNMIAAHNPRLGGLVVMPYEYGGSFPREFSQAQEVAREVMKNRAPRFTYGVADEAMDRLYMGDYGAEGAGPMSPAAARERARLRAMEDEMIPADVQ